MNLEGRAQCPKDWTFRHSESNASPALKPCRHRKKGTGHLYRGNSLIFHERGFNSSATRGAWDERYEAVSPGG